MLKVTENLFTMKKVVFLINRKHEKYKCTQQTMTCQ